jgi:predicted RNA-binding protein with PUA domain
MANFNLVLLKAKCDACGHKIEAKVVPPDEPGPIRVACPACQAVQEIEPQDD